MSTSNIISIFDPLTRMTDTPLTSDGVKEARIAGQLLGNDSRVTSIDVVFTSLLRRSTKTVWHVMEELELEWVPVVKDWRLNERSYGALVGRNKKQCVEQYGKDLVKRWRRSWDVPPPPMSKDSEYWPGRDNRYKSLGINLDYLPLSESLKDVTVRTAAFWDEVVVPQLKAGKRILIVGHENNLRSIIKRLDKISDDAIINIELPRAVPLLYELDVKTLAPVMLPDAAPGLSGRYLFDKKQLERIAERDHQQVYDLRVKATLETVRDRDLLLHSSHPSSYSIVSFIHRRHHFSESFLEAAARETTRIITNMKR